MQWFVQIFRVLFCFFTAQTENLYWSLHVIFRGRSCKIHRWMFVPMQKWARRLTSLPTHDDQDAKMKEANDNLLNRENMVSVERRGMMHARGTVDPTEKVVFAQFADQLNLHVDSTRCSKRHFFSQFHFWTVSLFFPGNRYHVKYWWN